MRAVFGGRSSNQVANNAEPGVKRASLKWAEPSPGFPACGSGKSGRVGRTNAASAVSVPASDLVVLMMLDAVVLSAGLVATWHLESKRRRKKKEECGFFASVPVKGSRFAVDPALEALVLRGLSAPEGR